MKIWLQLLNMMMFKASKSKKYVSKDIFIRVRTWIPSNASTVTYSNLKAESIGHAWSEDSNESTLILKQHKLRKLVWWLHSVGVWKLLLRCKRWRGISTFFVDILSCPDVAFLNHVAWEHVSLTCTLKPCIYSEASHNLQLTENLQSY